MCKKRTKKTKAGRKSSDGIGAVSRKDGERAHALEEENQWAPDRNFIVGEVNFRRIIILNLPYISKGAFFIFNYRYPVKNMYRFGLKRGIAKKIRVQILSSYGKKVHLSGKAKSEKVWMLKICAYWPKPFLDKFPTS
jgi:hypothetical protein